MIAILKQTASGRGADYRLERGGQLLCTARSPFSPTAPGIELFRQNQPWLRIAPNLGESIKRKVGNHTWRSAPCDIMEAGGPPIGRIARLREGTLFSSISYTELHLYDRVFHIYEIGLGKEGMKYPVYEGGAQIAQIEKDPVVYDNLDAYTLCSLDDFGELAALLTALFLDFHDYRNAGERARGQKSVQYVYTRKQEVLAKYDPSFRARCEPR